MSSNNRNNTMPGRSSDLSAGVSHVEKRRQSIADHFIIDACSEELYYCEACGNDFDSLESYNEAHSGPNGCTGATDTASHGIIHADDIVEDDLIEELDEASEPQLWEVLDDVEVVSPVNEVELDLEIEEGQDEQEDEEVVSRSERYFCFDCHSIFETRQSAEEHMCPQAEESAETDAKSKNDKFTKTPTPVRRKSSATTAATNGTSGTSTTCPICKTVFSSSKSLKFHMRIHNKRESKSIQDALPVGAHQQYSELDQFYCEICNKSFEQNLLNVHKEMHQSNKQYSCGICNRKFESIVNYEMHLKIHERPSSTSHTNKANDNAKKSADDKKPGFACQYCGHVFARPYEKVKHERVHTGEKPYSCEVCGKTFRVSYSLTLHLRTHTNIRPYVCTVCNKRFKSHTVYSHHLRIHSSEREYTCDSCPKSFRTSVQLYAHKNTHTKPYQCAVCNRPFASLYAVKGHMATHRTDGGKSGGNFSTGKSQQVANKYCCVTCGAEYARPFALRLHMKAAHGQSEGADIRIAKVPNHNVGEHEDIGAPDTETAVLIAAAKGDTTYHLDPDDSDIEDMVDVVPKYEECIEVSADAFDVETFQNEEIITDWLK